MNMNLKYGKFLALAAMVAIGGLTQGQACGKKDDDGESFRQIERLGRPAVNEGLVISNDNLNAWNSIPPSQDLGPQGSGVVGEVVAVLGALGNSSTRIGDIATAFLPDVMRVDTSIVSGYASGAIAVGSSGVVRPVGGRLITDDVIDITLSVLTRNVTDTGPIFTTDNVSYAGAGQPAQPGHSALLATFPFLAAPN
jgi:hypothetical protein